MNYKLNKHNYTNLHYFEFKNFQFKFKLKSNLNTKFLLTNYYNQLLFFQEELKNIL